MRKLTLSLVLLFSLSALACPAQAANYKARVISVKQVGTVALRVHWEIVDMDVDTDPDQVGVQAKGIRSFKRTVFRKAGETAADFIARVKAEIKRIRDRTILLLTQTESDRTAEFATEVDSPPIQ